MNVTNVRTIRLAVIALVAIFLVTACSGPEGTVSRTPSINDDGTPTRTGESPTVGGVAPSPTPQVESTPPAGDATPTVALTDPTATASPEPTATNTPLPTETPTPQPTATPEPTPTPEPPDVQGSLFPEHRIIAYYGHPSTPLMGILGEYSKEDLLQVLMQQIAEYEAADPHTRVIPAFELIATVAQPEPQNDGTYLLYTGDAWIGEYVEFTAENNMLLFLDLQIGHSTVPEQLNWIWHWLQYPHVHVAIDPEFATAPNHAPGTIIGGVDGSDINIAIEMLSNLVIQNNLPPKILIVHQFDTIMIRGKEDIQTRPGVDFVLHMDGWGSNEAKIANYHHFVRDQLIQWGGFKIFYRQDIPVMTAAEVLEMGPPPPHFISYQ